MLYIFGKRALSSTRICLESGWSNFMLEGQNLAKAAFYKFEWPVRANDQMSKPNIHILHIFE